MPSDLLERRPDIAAAERRMQEANARIGIAKAAYYPLISLAATGGFESIQPGTWFSGPSGLWGARSFRGHDAFRWRSATRRFGSSQGRLRPIRRCVSEIILTSFQDVEDNLAALRILETNQDSDGCRNRGGTYSDTLKQFI